MDTLKTIVADHIAKQKDAIAKQKAGLYDLQQAEERARAQRGQGEVYLQSMLARLDVLTTMQQEIAKGEAPKEQPPAPLPAEGGADA